MENSELEQKTEYKFNNSHQNIQIRQVGLVIFCSTSFTLLLKLQTFGVLWWLYMLVIFKIALLCGRTSFSHMVLLLFVKVSTCSCMQYLFTATCAFIVKTIVYFMLLIIMLTHRRIPSGNCCVFLHSSTIDKLTTFLPFY